LPGILSTHIWASFPNGTQYSESINSDSVTIVTIQDGSSAKTEPPGLSWVGSPDLSDWDVVLDYPNLGIKGTFTLKSV
jgi:hypothetical protein